MLNAFRHQRKGHANLGGAFVPAEKCSTPFGINGRVTMANRQITAGQDVLNAFRHQRKGHLDVATVQLDQTTVLNAFRHQRKGHGVKRTCRVWGRRVLNAFRHQRKGHSGCCNLFDERRLRWGHSSISGDLPQSWVLDQRTAVSRQGGFGLSLID